jgi:putative transcriptional regulator
MNVKIMRIKKGLTQQQLRKKAKISPNKLVQIERGDYSNVTFEQMIRIANVLDADPKELFFSDEKEG